MPAEAVQQFWQKAQSDESLQAQLSAIQEKERHATVAAIVKVAAVAGFVFTAEEYEADLDETLAKHKAAGELSQAQLAALAGGVFMPASRLQCDSLGN
jgi:predicted ribosomally synthesized peptide with nif11-like leader